MVTRVGWAQTPSPGGTAAASFAIRTAAETTYDVTASLAGTAASRGDTPPAGRGTLSAQEGSGGPAAPGMVRSVHRR